MKKKTLVIIGRMGSGKTSIRDHLVSLKINPIMEYTDRPMRENEKDGVDYVFLSKEEMLDKINQNEFICCSKYNATFGEVHYAIRSEDFKPNSVLATNPDNLKILMNSDLKDELYVVLIATDKETRRSSLMNRGDDPEEISLRMESEEKQFGNIEQYLDDIFCNAGFKYTVADMAERILNEYNYHQYV